VLNGAWCPGVVPRHQDADSSVDGKTIGSFSSPGIAHETKRVLRLLVSNKVTLDDVKYYKKK
jgi:hypothetical protein